MKRFLSLAFVFALFALHTQCNAQGYTQPIAADRVVAVVNSEAITLYELRSRVAGIERNLRKQGTPLPSMNELEKQVLERMILDRIQVQSASDQGMRVGDAELEAAMGRIAQGNKMTVGEFKAVLEKDGVIWSKFREEIRQEITIARLRDREVDSRITISEGEIDNYLSSADAKGDTAEYVLAHIIVRLPEQAGPEQIARLRSKAEKALQLLRQGEDFGKVATTYSDAPDALSGGSLGVRSADRLPTLYAQAAEKMRPGETSEILRSPAGFHILRLVDKRGGKIAAQSIKQTRARHILIKVNEVVSEAEAKRKIDVLKERIDNGTNFTDIAKQHSNDLSAPKGGDLGWLNQGDTVPEFEKAMDALPLNKVSAPIRTPFGWHLILVTERKQDEGSQERLRLAAKQALRERKSDEAYQDWLRQMRDRAYVEYRLDDR